MKKRYIVGIVLGLIFVGMCLNTSPSDDDSPVYKDGEVMTAEQAYDGYQEESEAGDGEGMVYKDGRVVSEDQAYDEYIEESEYGTY